jgi:hypothetical protein
MIENHLLACAKQVPSLNYNERPNDKVSLVVIHNSIPIEKSLQFSLPLKLDCPACQARLLNGTN